MIGIFGRPIAQIVQEARPEVTLDALDLVKPVATPEPTPEPLARSA